MSILNTAPPKSAWAAPVVYSENDQPRVRCHLPARIRVWITSSLPHAPDSQGTSSLATCLSGVDRQAAHVFQRVRFARFTGQPGSQLLRGCSPVHARAGRGPCHTSSRTTRTNTLRTQPFAPDRRKGFSYVNSQAFTALDHSAGRPGRSGYLLRRRSHDVFPRGKRRPNACFG